MTGDKKYTDHDLEMAKEQACLTAAVRDLEKTFLSYMGKHDDEHRKMWQKVDANAKAIMSQQKQIYRGMGFVGGLGFLLGYIGTWIKAKLFGG